MKLLHNLFLPAVILASGLTLNSCGGTITLSPTGEISYTTPKLIQPAIKPAK